MEIVFTFQDTNHAVKAERVLLEGGLDVTVMPLPSTIRAGCGLCLRLPPEQFDAGRDLLLEACVPVENLYTRYVENGKSIYTQCGGDA